MKRQEGRNRRKQRKGRTEGPVEKKRMALEDGGLCRVVVNRKRDEERRGRKRHDVLSERGH